MSETSVRHPQPPSINRSADEIHGSRAKEKGSWEGPLASACVEELTKFLKQRMIIFVDSNTWVVIERSTPSF